MMHAMNPATSPPLGLPFRRDASIKCGAPLPMNRARQTARFWTAPIHRRFFHIKAALKRRSLPPWRDCRVGKRPLPFMVPMRSFETVEVLHHPASGVNRHQPGIGYGTAPTPDGRWLIVALISVNKVGVIDLASMETVRSLDVPRAPQEVLVRPDGTAAYVSCDASHQVAVIDLKNWKVERLIDAGPGALTASMWSLKGAGLFGRFLGACCPKTRGGCGGRVLSTRSTRTLTLEL